MSLGVVDTNAKVGFVGAGRMGSQMILRLVKAGYDVAVYNRTRSKLDSLVAEGAKAADTVAELADREVVFISVASSDDFLEVTLGSNGILSQGTVPKVIVDVTTVSTESSQRVRDVATERGSALLACPVSGNPRVAAAGKLTMAVSGPHEAFQYVEPLLNAIGAGSTYVGEGELARLVKLCHNLFLGVVTQSMAEITTLAEKGGVSREIFLEYLNKSVMGSMFSRYKVPAFVNLDFHPTFTSKLLRKDFDLGLSEARALEVPMPVAGLVHQLVQSLIGEGFGDEDFATLLLLQARSAGMKLESERSDVTDGL